VCLLSVRVFIKTFHTLRLTLAVLEGMASGAFCWEPVDVCIDFFLIHCAGNVHVIKNSKKD